VDHTHERYCYQNLFWREKTADHALSRSAGEIPIRWRSSWRLGTRDIDLLCELAKHKAVAVNLLWLV